MKKFLKMTALIGLLLLVLLTSVSCKNIIAKIPFLNKGNETEATTPETTTPSEVQDHSHQFGEWTTVQAATCEENGLQERACSCGEKETQEINALGHTEVADAAVAPTCTTDGLTAGTHCSACGEVLLAQDVIPAEHNWAQTALLQSATCFTYGEEHRACRVCGVEENAPVEPLKHNFVTDEETGFHICTYCNGVLFAGHVYVAFEEELHWFDAYQACEDMGGHLVTITSEQEQAIISDLMNSELRTNDVYYAGGIRLSDNQFHWITGEAFAFDNWASGEPNNSSGNQHFIAIRSFLSNYPTASWDDCFYEIKIAFVCEWELDIPDCEHTFTEWEVVNETTCWNDGGQYRSCTYCGAEETEVLPKLEHNFVLNEESGIEMCEHCNAAKYNSHIYVLFTDTLGWFDAYSRCEALDGHLATITSEEEQIFVSSYLRSIDPTCSPWLGGYSDGKQWHWVTDELFDYTYWKQGEPSNSAGREWFLHTNYAYNEYSDKFDWNDYPPSEILTTYLCEFECEE